MAYTLVNNGDVPDENYFNSLMKQSVIVCTSGTRPATPPTGMTIYETDTNRYSSYTGSAWVTLGQTVVASYTPVLTGATTNPVLGTGSSAVGRYTLWGGKMCTYWGRIVWGSSGGTAGSGQYFVSIPTGLTSSSAVTVLTAGSAMLRDDSAGTVSPGVCYIGSGVTTLALTSTSGIVGSGTPWAWTNLDYLMWNITFEIA